MRKIFILVLIKLFILIFLIFSSNTSAFSQDVLGQSVSTNEYIPTMMDFQAAIKYSLEHNNSIRAMRKALSATEKDIGIAKSEMMPKVVLNENFTVTNNPIEAFGFRLNQTVAKPGDLAFGTLDYPGAVTNFLTAGVIQQPILNKKSMIGIKIAKKEYSVNGYVFLRKQEELVCQVAQAYLKVDYSKDFFDVATQAAKSANITLKMTEAQYKKGAETYANVLRAMTAVDLREEQKISAKRDLELAKRNLGLSLGLEIPVEISDSISDIKLTDINYYKGVSVFRNDIKATEIKVENAKNHVKSAQADLYPTLNAVASYNFYNANYPFGGQGNNYIAGAVFKWDVFDGNKTHYEILKAKDKESESKEYLAALKKSVNFKIYEAYSKVLESQENFRLASKSKEQAEENVKLIEKLWLNSKVPYVSLIDAKVNLNSVSYRVIKAKFETREALINLCYESGIIYQELGLK